MHYGGYEILNAHCIGPPLPLSLPLFSGSLVCHFRSQSFGQSDFICAPCLKRENFSLFMGKELMAVAKTHYP